MKRIALIIIVFFLFCFTLNAQINIVGQLNLLTKNIPIFITNFDGLKTPIGVNANKKFVFATDSLLEGIYNIDEIGSMYLANGYNLIITPDTTNNYLFEGMGAIENNTLITAKRAISKYLPMDSENENYGGLAQEAFYMEPVIFLQKIDSYKTYCKTLFNSSTNGIFTTYANLDLEYYCKPFIFFYYSCYGKNIKLMDEALQNFTNADASNIVVAATEYFELSQKATIKVLSNKDRESLLNIVNKDWDKNNEKLFKNSFCYREEFTKYFILIASDKRYRTTAMLNPEDTYIKNLSITNDAITNPYSLNYFNYTNTNNIVKVQKIPL